MSCVLFQIQEDQKQSDELEAAFQTVRQATGLSDVKDIVKKFLTRHNTYDQLQQQAAMTRERIEALKAEKTSLSAQLDEVSATAAPVNDHRGTYFKIEEYERRLRVVRGCGGVYVCVADSRSRAY